MIPYNLIYLGVSLLFAAYVIKKLLEYAKAKVSAQSKITALKSAQSNNPLSHFSSLSEMFGSMAQGSDLSAQQIANECRKQGKDPMKDVGYMTQVKNVQRFSEYSERLQKNQVLAIADNFLFPIAKDVYPKIPKIVSGFIKGLS